MPNYTGNAKLAAPTPRHWQTASAERARQAVRDHATRRKAAELVTKHPRPEEELRWPVPASADQLAKAATALGFEVRVAHGWATVNTGRANEARKPAVQVAGINRARRRGFRATWADGRAHVGVWYGPAPEAVGVAEVKARVIGRA